MTLAQRIAQKHFVTANVQAGAGEAFQKINPKITDEQVERINEEHAKNRDNFKAARVFHGYVNVENKVRELAHKIPAVRSVIDRALGVHVKAMAIPEAEKLLQDVYDALDEVKTLLVEDTGFKSAGGTAAEGQTKSALRGVEISKGQVDRDLKFSLTLLVQDDTSDEANFALKQALKVVDRILGLLDDVGAALAHPKTAALGSRVVRRYLASVRRATINDAGTLKQLIEMQVESMTDELPRDERLKAIRGVKVTPEVKEAAKSWDTVVKHALIEWCSKHMDVFKLGEGPLHGASTAEDVADVMMDLRGGAGYLYYMEHEGMGVGTEDGDWDALFHTPNSTIKILSQHMLGATRQAYKGLSETIFDAALEEVPQEDPDAREASLRRQAAVKNEPELLTVHAKMHNGQLYLLVNAPGHGLHIEDSPKEALETIAKILPFMYESTRIDMMKQPKQAATSKQALTIDMDLAKAYADAWSKALIAKEGVKFLPPEKLTALLEAHWDDTASDLRNLQFRSSKWMTPAVWTAQMKAICPDYNEFNAAKVGRWLAGFHGIEVQPAREYSVCLYVKGNEAALTQMADAAEHAVGADEAYVADGVLRLWWD